MTIGPPIVIGADPDITLEEVLTTPADERSLKFYNAACGDPDFAGSWFICHEFCDEDDRLLRKEQGTCIVEWFKTALADEAVDPNIVPLDDEGDERGHILTYCLRQPEFVEILVNSGKVDFEWFGKPEFFRPLAHFDYKQDYHTGMYLDQGEEHNYQCDFVLAMLAEHNIDSVAWFFASPALMTPERTQLILDQIGFSNKIDYMSYV